MAESERIVVPVRFSGKPQAGGPDATGEAKTAGLLFGCPASLARYLAGLPEEV
jgi:hypothetical protein